MKRLIKYAVTMAVGALLVLLIAHSKDIWTSDNLKNTYHILCDSFFVAGWVITASGILCFSSNEGVFDGLMYGIRSFMEMFKRHPDRRYPTLYDYKESRADKKMPVLFLILCGLVYLAVAFVMYYLYSKQ